MTRAFRPDPVPHDLIEHLVDLASRAPSAGKTQGWHLIVLEGADTARFWDSTMPLGQRERFGWPHLLDAPVITVPLADPAAYVDRYDEPDKAGARSDGGRLGSGTEAWPAPYWTIDAAMAVMTLLLAAEDAGLGALFFGVFHGEDALRGALGVPATLDVLGAIALGWPLGADAAPAGGSAGRPRRRPSQIIHRGGW
jgi:nitroreductase